MKRLAVLIKKELLQIRRDRKMLPFLVVAPTLQLLALGYAANLDVTGVPLLVVDQDRTAASRELVSRFTASESFDLVGTEDSVAAVEPWLVEGRAQIALVVGVGWGEALAAGRRARVQVLADGSDSTAAGLGLAYASRILGGVSAEQLAARVEEVVRQRGVPPPGQVDAVPRVWYNPDLKSRWFFVPAVLALVLMVLTLVLSSVGIVREKEVGTLEQLIVTPVRPWQLIAGKLIPFLLIAVVDIFIVTGITVGWFGVPLEGSFLLLVALTMLMLLTTLSLGLLVSTLVSTQQQAMITATFVFMVPMIYLSGLIFPIENMPTVIQKVTYAVPLRYYAVILRGIFLKGAGLDALWHQALALAGFGVGFLTLASLRFRKRLD